jgi:cytochrome c biogenesis protein CcdA
MVVVMDSPLFSTLVAQSADPSLKGTALTIVNCLGFGLTIVSIQLLSYLLKQVEVIWIYPLLAIGPLLGVIATVSGENRRPKPNVK